MEVPKEDITKVPYYGLKLKLDHVYPENWSQNRIPTFRQLWAILGLTIRYFIYYVKLYFQGKRPIMDFLNTLKAKQIYGVPIGGLGCGTIGRGFRGEFCRFQLRPGMYEYNTVDANQFIVTIKDESEKTIFQSVLSAYKEELKSLSSWQCLIDGSKCNYTGLYPRSWTEYDLSDYGIRLICRQISPVIPNNYKDSSLPCAVFEWQVENVSNENLTVTIAFTFQNGIGVKKVDSESTCSSKPFSYLNSEGVILYHQIDKMKAIYALGAGIREDINITKCVYFDPNSDGKTLWEQLYENGRFEKVADKRFDHRFGEMGVAIAAQMTVPRYEKKSVDLSLVWDIPNVTFVGKRREYSKFYTSIFGSNNATLKIVDYALKNYGMWEEEIYKWQSPILSDPNLPEWYKGTLFNQTYFVSDGGSVWFNIDEKEAEQMDKDDPRLQYGRYGYLEGHEYRMYNTYDVHFYASYTLAVNWPKLQLSIQYDLRDSIFMENKDLMYTLHDGVKAERKVKDSVPHDLGDPWEDPYLLVNAYNIFDVSEWRDLNTKFVLQVFRDYKLGVGDEKYLRDMYKALDTVMVKSEAFDTDGDGIIDNQGIADQTYDNWIMTGASAYCGGLWLAALYAMTVIGEKLGEEEDVNRYKNILEKGKKSFERKLWNGKYYNFDMSDQGHSIMADQMCGHWYLRTSGCNYEILPKENVSTALKTIYDNNVLLFKNGNQGAVNGIIDGKTDTVCVQSEEAWIGVNSALASLMIYEGMPELAWKTVGGIYKTMNEKLGLAFQYPEALYTNKYYRSIGYMRPLSIWSIQLAYEHVNKTK